MKGSGKMFETGEYVVYGRTGICQVTGVTTMRVDGSSGEKLYYVLRPGGETDGKIFTPVEGGKQVLRGIITREEAERLIDEIPSIETLSIENEKFREDSYKKCIRTCECRDLLRIIKTIYVRKQARLSHGKKTTAFSYIYRTYGVDIKERYGLVCFICCENLIQLVRLLFENLFCYIFFSQKNCVKLHPLGPSKRMTLIAGTLYHYRDPELLNA